MKSDDTLKNNVAVGIKISGLLYLTLGKSLNFSYSTDSSLRVGMPV